MQHQRVRLVVPFAVVVFLLASAVVAFSATTVQPIRPVGALLAYDSKGQLVGSADIDDNGGALVTVKIGKEVMRLFVDRTGIFTTNGIGGLLWESPNCTGTAFQADGRVPTALHAQMAGFGMLVYAYSGPARAIAPASMRTQADRVLGPCLPFDYDTYVNAWGQTDPTLYPYAPSEAVADLDQFVPPFNLRTAP